MSDLCTWRVALFHRFLPGAILVLTGLRGFAQTGETEPKIPGAQFYCIRGQFEIDGYRPDGDSLRFRPNDPDIMTALSSAYVRKKDGNYQLRLLGIDAPEMNCEGLRQPLAGEARDRLLEFLGFKEVRVDDSGVIRSTGGAVRGAICALDVDHQDRPLCIAFSAVPDAWADGEPTLIEPESFTKSANFTLVEEGLAYPLFYDYLQPDIRESITEAAADARGRGTGVWGLDRTASFEFATRSDLVEQLVHPAVFRRAVRYAKPDTTPTPAGFAAWMGKHCDLVIESIDGKPTRFADLVSCDGTQVKLRGEVWNLVFLDESESGDQR